MKYPYFRITEWFEGRSVIESWFEHLKNLGHPCCMVRELMDYANKTQYMYSVWRVGEETVNRVSYSNAIANSEPITGAYEVVSIANGWGE